MIISRRMTMQGCESRGIMTLLYITSLAYPEEKCVENDRI